VRRLFSAILLLVFSLPLISPVLALASDSDQNLPACCRRNGAHHCKGMPHLAGSPHSGATLSTISPRCPSYPAVVTQVRHGDLSLHTASLIFAGIVSHPTIKLQTHARARVALDRSRRKRGPPSNLI
jgi:hypothetical protein